MAAGDLTTLEDVRLYLDVKVDTDDKLLSRLITAASAFINNYLNRNLLIATYLHEKYSGIGSTSIVLRNAPIQSVSSVVVNGVAVPASVDGIATGYAFGAFTLAYIGGIFPKGFNNIAVSYTAGYTAVPADVAEACIELVALHYREKSRIGKKSDSLPQGGTTTYSDEALSPRAKAALSNYRRMVPV